jgi:hypothetical protein
MSLALEVKVDQGRPTARELDVIHAFSYVARPDDALVAAALLWRVFSLGEAIRARL